MKLVGRKLETSWFIPFLKCRINWTADFGLKSSKDLGKIGGLKSQV